MGIKVHNPREPRLDEEAPHAGKVVKVGKNFITVREFGKRPRRMRIKDITELSSIDDEEHLTAEIRGAIVETALKQERK